MSNQIKSRLLKMFAVLILTVFGSLNCWSQKFYLVSHLPSEQNLTEQKITKSYLLINQHVTLAYYENGFCSERLTLRSPDILIHRLNKKEFILYNTNNEKARVKVYLTDSVKSKNVDSLILDVDHAFFTLSVPASEFYENAIDGLHWVWIYFKDKNVSTTLGVKRFTLKLYDKTGNVTFEHRVSEYPVSPEIRKKLRQHYTDSAILKLTDIELFNEDHFLYLSDQIFLCPSINNCDRYGEYSILNNEAQRKMKIQM